MILSSFSPWSYEEKFVIKSLVYKEEVIVWDKNRNLINHRHQTYRPSSKETTWDDRFLLEKLKPISVTISPSQNAIETLQFFMSYTFIYLPAWGLAHPLGHYLHTVFEEWIHSSEGKPLKNIGCDQPGHTWKRLGLKGDSQSCYQKNNYSTKPRLKLSREQNTHLLRGSLRATLI